MIQQDASTDDRFAELRVTTSRCGSKVAPADFARWVLEPAAGDAR